jgi:hypothetical protein
MSSETPWTTTVLGWTVLAGGAGLAYAYYSRDANRRAIRGRNNRVYVPTNRVAAPEEEVVRSRARRQNRRQTGAETSEATTSDGGVSNARGSKTQISAVAPAALAYSGQEEQEEQEDVAWAAELASKQRNAAPATSQMKEAAKRPKTVRQANANKVASDNSLETSTTGGGDADDDFSHSSLSPQLGSTALDVSDMLEPVAPGPSIIRLVQPANPLPKREKPAPKAPVQEESKKQRQNRKKAEEKKLLREDDERLRRVQLEQQRRTAREARGEPAKNGLESAPPASNAWTKPAAVVTPHVNGNGHGNGNSTGTGNGLLDTFEAQRKPANGAPKAKGAKGAYWENQLPSEEEQMRLLLETDDSQWQTVEKKAKSKRKNTDASEAANGGAVQPVDAQPKPKPERLAKTNAEANGQHISANDFHSPLESSWTS